MSFTRRDFLSTSAAAAVAGVVGHSPLVRAWQQQGQSQGVFTDLRRRVGHYTLQGGTIGYLADPKGGVVVDSQFAKTAPIFIQEWNQRTKEIAVHRLINTHHHGDHTGGNAAFKGVARQIVAHATCAAHTLNPPGRKPTPDAVAADRTFTDQWREQVGDEFVRAKYYGRAHTSGDAVITFERANVAHMGDLMFHRRHPVVDRAAGASIRNWIVVLEKATAEHTPDTIYIYGHANTNLPVSGPRADVMFFRDYLSAVMGWVEAQVKAGRSQEEIFAMRDPIKGFEMFGPLPNPNPGSVIHSAYDEVTNK
jgi:glyoxylase-like metal-dependent hydrolase (beta-lactamase superfamily II)